MSDEYITLEQVRGMQPAKPQPSDGEYVTLSQVRAMQPAGGDSYTLPQKGPIPAPSLVIDDPGTGKALVMGAGRGVDKLLAGVRQLYYKATGNEQAQSDLDAEQARNRMGYAPFKRAAPIATGIGESLPGIAISTPLTGGASLPALMLRGALAGSLPGLLEYGDTAQRMDRGVSGAIGGAGGALVGYGLAKALQPTQALTQVGDDAVQAAKNIGYQPTAAERTGNPAQAAFENYLSRTPGYSSQMAARRTANQAALNRAAAGAIGERADDVSEGVLRAANSRMGQEYSRLNAAATPDASSRSFLDALFGVDKANVARGPYARADIAREVEKGLELAYQGKVPGTAYQEIRSELGSAAKAAFASGDSTKGNAIKSIQSGLDAAAKESLSAADQAALDLVRKQYAAFKVLTKGQVVEGGNVSAARLATALRQQNPTGFKTGTINSDLMDIARIGQAFKPVANPNSSMPSVMQQIANSPLGALPMAVTNRALGSLYMNPVSQAYLSAQWLSPQMQRAMIATGAPGGLLGVTSLRNVARE